MQAYPSGYERFLKDILHAINAEIEGFDWHLPSLAKDAGVSLTTLHKFTQRCVWRPRLDTLFKVSKAVGLELTVTQRRRLRRAA